MRKGPSRKEQGFIWLGHYRYARKDKITGKYRIYEGYWGSSEDNTTGLQVVRHDQTKKILEFDSMEQVKRFLGHRL